MSGPSRYRYVPIIKVNTKYELQIEYPDWSNGNSPAVQTYKLGRLSNGKVGVSSTNNYYYGEHDTCNRATLSIVYEDENLFGSAGLLHNGNYRLIKLKGFAKAVESFDYHKKWDNKVAEGHFEQTDAERHEMYRHLHEATVAKWGLEEENVRMIVVDH